MAQYRGGRPMAGYASLRRNVDLTWAQDPGAVTEVLSGRFYVPLGRSSTHQLWSSAMVITPTLRGIFGLEWKAAENKLTVTPNLPAQWNEAKILGVPLGRVRVGVEIRRNGSARQIQVGMLPGDRVYFLDLTADQYLSMEELTKLILDRVLFPKLQE